MTFNAFNPTVIAQLDCAIHDAWSPPDIRGMAQSSCAMTELMVVTA
jgi:hypothetical protein